MQKKFKALICDLDGTFVPNGGNTKPSQKVKTAVEKISRKIYVGFATGRTYQYVENILEECNFTAPCIINGGAMIIDPKTRDILWQQPMEKDDALTLFKLFKDLPFWFSIVEDKDRVVLPKTYSPIKPIKIHLGHLTPKDVKTITKLLPKLPTITYHVAPDWEKGKLCMDISHVRATKQYGIYEVAKFLKINSHEIIGVGDGGNDIPLLMACGLKVAMGNANEDLKDIADIIAPSVEKDGVAWVIEKYLL